MTKKPKLKITNQQAVDLWTNYQNIYSQNITEFIPMARSTSIRAIRYAMEWGEEQSLYKTDPFRQSYLTVPTEVFLQAFDVDIKKALKAVKGRT